MLENKIRDKTAVVGVMGLGYVGLPLAMAFAREGLNVEGFDIDVNKVVALRRGHTTIQDVGIEELRIPLEEGKLNFTFSMNEPWLVDVVIVCVPTPITDDKKPDLSYITDALTLLSSHIKSDDILVVLESSTYPGTTRDLVVPILKDKVKYIAYSPERIDPGNKKYGIQNTPKLVGGIDKKSTELATLLYSQIVNEVVPVSSPEVAEMAKLFENVFRNVNIALVNEMALLCERLGISVWEMIDAAATKPFGFMPFYPGVGVGGHCVKVDPYYVVGIAEKHDVSTGLTELALDINENMPACVSHRLAELIWKQGKKVNESKVMIFGVAFKGNISDTRESPALELIRMLLNMGVDVLYNDPYVPEVEVDGKILVSSSLDRIEDMDCVVIATAHSCYDYDDIVDRAKLVFDTRGVTRGMTRINIRRLGEK